MLVLSIPAHLGSNIPNGKSNMIVAFSKFPGLLFKQSQFSYQQQYFQKQLWVVSTLLESTCRLINDDQLILYLKMQAKRSVIFFYFAFNDSIISNRFLTWPFQFAEFPKFVCFNFSTIKPVLSPHGNTQMPWCTNEIWQPNWQQSECCLEIDHQVSQKTSVLWVGAHKCWVRINLQSTGELQCFFMTHRRLGNVLFTEAL